MIGMHPSQDVVRPKGENRNVGPPLLLSVKVTMGPRREECQVPRDKATHGLQRRWVGGVGASVGCWSQLTKLSTLRLHASLGFLYVWPHSVPPSAQWDALCSHTDPFIPLVQVLH